MRRRAFVLREDDAQAVSHFSILKAEQLRKPSFDAHFHRYPHDHASSLENGLLNVSSSRLFPPAIKSIKFPIWNW